MTIAPYPIGIQCRNCQYAQQPSQALACPRCGSLDLHFYPATERICLCGHGANRHVTHPQVKGAICSEQSCRCRQFREEGS